MKKLVMAAALLAASLHTLAADAADCSALTKLDGGNPTANPVPTVLYFTKTPSSRASKASNGRGVHVGLGGPGLTGSF